MGKEKKHKKDKKKEKDKDKERDKSKGSSDTPKGLKIKLSGTPSGSPGRDTNEEGGSSSTPGTIPKIKIKLGGTVRTVGEEESGKKDKDSRKRERTASMA